jgi:hypothetical protein
MIIHMKTIKDHMSMLRFAGTVILLALLSYSCEDLLDTDTGDDRDKLVDTWKVIDESSPLKSEQGAYWVEIEKHPDKQNMILIYFFHGLGDNVYAEASLSGTTLILGQQVLEGGWTVQGSGEIQKSWDEIIWAYKADDGSGFVEKFTAVYTRIGL